MESYSSMFNEASARLEAPPSKSAGRSSHEGHPQRRGLFLEAFDGMLRSPVLVPFSAPCDVES